MGKRVSLVLSCGGARGLAQIGAIEELERQGFIIEAVSGSSIGAVVGGLYAAGKLSAYKEWMLRLSKMDVFRLIDFNLGSPGFIKGERVFEEMNRLTGDCMIEDLKVEFTAVTTDLIANREVWVTKGSLLKAIRKSAAVPSVLLPVYEDGKAFVDGGVTSPIPIGPVLNRNHDLIIVINSLGDIPYVPQYHPTKEEIKEENEYLKKLNVYKQKWSHYWSQERKEVESVKVWNPGFFGLLNRSIDLMEQRLIDYILKTHQPDLVIPISYEICGMFEFYKAKELVEEGRIAARKALEEFNLRLKHKELQVMESQMPS